VPQPSRLSAPALEVLAIIAYRQPLGRAEIEDIRGVGSSGVLRTLVERNLVEPVGRSEGLGRPLLYGTTKKFLEHFGFRSLEDLPRPDELPVVLRDRTPVPPPADPSDGTTHDAAYASDAAPAEPTSPAEAATPAAETTSDEPATPAAETSADDAATSAAETTPDEAATSAAETSANDAATSAAETSSDEGADDAAEETAPPQH